MIKAVAEFKKLAPNQSIYKIATDDGGEFKLDNRNKGLSPKNPKFKMDWETFWDQYKEKGPKWRLTFVRVASGKPKPPLDDFTLFAPIFRVSFYDVLK